MVSIGSLVMKPLDTQTSAQIPNYEFSESVAIKDDLVKRNTLKGSQFQQPLLEFSGAGSTFTITNTDSGGALIE